MINLLILMLILCVPAMVFADQKTEFELKAIDRKIAELKAEYHKEQLTEMHKEVESQDLMIADWPAFGQEAQEIKKLDMQTDKILKEIEELEQRKNTLIKQNAVK